MTLYIPKHLHLLEIVKYLVDMLTYYLLNHFSSEKIDIDLYYYLYSLDPVKRFINMCISDDDIDEDQNKDLIVNYILNRFYYAKGTYEILNLMKRFLGIKFNLDPIYTGNNIELNIDTVEVSNISVWAESLKEFLDHLLYYDLIVMTIKDLTLNIEDTLEGYLGNKLICYKKFEVSV